MCTVDQPNNLWDIANYLAKEYGYRYVNSPEYTALDYSERQRVNRMILQIIEMEN